MNNLKIIFVTFCFLMLSISVSRAQICNTGHFEFEVSDLWEMQLYGDDIIYWGPNKERLLVTSSDMTDKRRLKLDEIEEMYDLFSQKHKYRKEYINNDMIALFNEPDPMYSLDYPDDECLMYYRDGYLLSLTYSPYEAEADSANTFGRIIKTIKRSDKPKSKYKFRTVMSKHFFYEVPSQWFHVNIEDADLYYGGTEQNADHGMLHVIEGSMSDFPSLQNASIEEFYESVAQDLYESVNATSERSSRLLSIDGKQLYISKFFYSLYTGYMYSTICRTGDNVLILTYMDGRSSGMADFSDNIVEAIGSSVRSIRN